MRSGVNCLTINKLILKECQKVTKFGPLQHNIQIADFQYNTAKPNTIVTKSVKVQYPIKTTNLLP